MGAISAARYLKGFAGKDVKGGESVANGTKRDGAPASAGGRAAEAFPVTPPPGGMPAIAMFHSVSPYDEDPYLVTVTPERFDRQMRWLRRRGLRGVSVSAS